MNNSLLAGIGGVVVGSLVGFVGGGAFSDSPDAAVEKGVAQSTKTERSLVRSSELGSNGSRSTRSDMMLNDIFLEGSKSERMRMLLDYYANLSPEEFASEAAKLETLPFSDRMFSSFLLFSAWAEVDPMAALAYSSDLGREGFLANTAILSSWASTDPEAAARYLEENPNQFRNGRGPGGAGVGSIATEWARQDPKAALAWAQSLDGREGEAAIGSVLRQVATSDPYGAVAMAADLSGEARLEAYQDIAGQWALTDWDSAESWINGLPASERDEVMGDAIASLADADPVMASEKVLAMGEGEAKDNAISSVVEEWAESDPVAAMDFLLANGSSEAQEDAMRDTMRSLAREDSSQALTYIDAMESGEVRDTAVGTYIFSNRDLDPQEAINLAATVSDGNASERLVTMSASRWLQEDSAAATEFVNTTDLLSDDQKARILSGEVRIGGRRGEGGGRRR
ncbi:MAG: hypothetical protein Q7Q71_01600 [Verrucomicrobiota bacterium JB023]|nr:hypothetical protein [Verrucomicrobiota bacterium JB023]